jgi:hypothetical protein
MKGQKNWQTDWKIYLLKLMGMKDLQNIFMPFAHNIWRNNSGIFKSIEENTLNKLLEASITWIVQNYCDISQKHYGFS